MHSWMVDFAVSPVPYCHTILLSTRPGFPSSAAPYRFCRYLRTSGSGRTFITPASHSHTLLRLTASLYLTSSDMVDMQPGWCP